MPRIKIDPKVVKFGDNKESFEVVINKLTDSVRALATGGKMTAEVAKVHYNANAEAGKDAVADWYGDYVIKFDGSKLPESTDEQGLIADTLLADIKLAGLKEVVSIWNALQADTAKAALTKLYGDETKNIEKMVKMFKDQFGMSDAKARARVAEMRAEAAKEAEESAA